MCAAVGETDSVVGIGEGERKLKVDGRDNDN